MSGNKYICKNCDKELTVYKGDNIDDDKYIIFVYPCSCVAPWMEDDNLVKREYKYKVYKNGNYYVTYDDHDCMIKLYKYYHLTDNIFSFYEIEKKTIYKSVGVIDRVIKTKREITIEKNTGGEWGYFYKN